jgi:hypothetical protein
MTSGTALTLRGKLIHLASTWAGRIGRGQTHAFEPFIANGGGVLSIPLMRNLEFHRHLLHLKQYRVIDLVPDVNQLIGSKSNIRQTVRHRTDIRIVVGASSSSSQYIRDRVAMVTGKAFDDACPLGPKIVPARFVDTRDLRLTLTVNGETKQDASSSDMIWSVAEQASLLSEFVTIEPGDVLLTGTPAGVGLASGTYLKVGDRIEATISGLGTMSVVVVPDSPSSGTPRVA